MQHPGREGQRECEMSPVSLVLSYQLLIPTQFSISIFILLYKSTKTYFTSFWFTTQENWKIIYEQIIQLLKCYTFNKINLQALMYKTDQRAKKELYCHKFYTICFDMFMAHWFAIYKYNTKFLTQKFYICGKWVFIIYNWLNANMRLSYVLIL